VYAIVALAASVTVTGAIALNEAHPSAAAIVYATV
jgi:hypothetical protein